MKAMENSYIIRQIANLMGVSVCIYNRKTGEKDSLGRRSADRQYTDGQNQRICKEIMFREADYPLLVNMEDSMLLGEIFLGEERWLLTGPIIPSPVDSDFLDRTRKKNNFILEMGFQIGSCELTRFVTGLLALYWCTSGHEMSAEEFWERNESVSQRVREVVPRMNRDFFEQSESGVPHNPYEQELRELESIQCGDVEALRQSVAETYEGKIGILARNPLRSQKNVAVANITLASRAAIKGGVSEEQAFSMADSLIRQIEEVETIPEVELLKREAQVVYAQAVQEQQRFERKSYSPLIINAKNYIFSHLHGNIRVSDIASYLGVNANYLSALFSEQEKITLKQYILREKVRRSQNLLKYSDYRIQEISFYLGFSSQSHFTKVFQKFAGMSPHEYRSQFGTWGNWKST